MKEHYEDTMQHTINLIISCHLKCDKDVIDILRYACGKVRKTREREELVIPKYSFFEGDWELLFTPQKGDRRDIAEIDDGYVVNINISANCEYSKLLVQFYDWLAPYVDNDKSGCYGWGEGHIKFVNTDDSLCVKLVRDGGV